MAAHPDISIPKAEAIAGYILSLAAVGDDSDLPISGQLKLSPPAGKNPNGVFVFIANYVDKGAEGMDPIKGQAIVSLRSPRIRASEYAELRGGEQQTVTSAALPQLAYNQEALAMDNGGQVSFGPMDLTGVRSLELKLDLRAEESQAGQVALYLDDPEAPAFAKIDVQPVSNHAAALTTFQLPLPETSGAHRLYLRFSADNPDANRPICRLLSFTLKTDASGMN